jgi:mannose-6-phosphate isomerase-like protein (cupin superfamily)
MRLIKTSLRRSKMFDLLHATSDLQAAMMTLRPGGASSEQPENEHARSEQWLFVIAGSGKARVGRRTVALRAGDLLLIEKNEPHKISNTGRRNLVTINFYAPPAYREDGEVRMRARNWILV